MREWGVSERRDRPVAAILLRLACGSGRGLLVVFQRSDDNQLVLGFVVLVFHPRRQDGELDVVLLDDLSHEFVIVGPASFESVEIIDGSGDCHFGYLLDDRPDRLERAEDRVGRVDLRVAHFAPRGGVELRNVLRRFLEDRHMVLGLVPHFGSAGPRPFHLASHCNRGQKDRRQKSGNAALAERGNGIHATIRE